MRVLQAMATLFIGIAVGTAKADLIPTIYVNAVFAEENGPLAGTSFDPGPSTELILTGKFTFDIGTSTINSFDMAFLGPNGSSSQFSSKTGLATASCLGFDPVSICPTRRNAATWWEFTFADANANVSLMTLYASGVLVSGDYYLCAQQETFYPGNVVGVSPPCAATSYGSFGGERGDIYNPPPGSPEVTSGVLTVTLPEPSEPALLLLGIGLIFGIGGRVKLLDIDGRT